MEVVVGIAIVFLLSATLLGMLLVFPAMWIGFRDQWRCFPAERRRRGTVAGALVAVCLAVATTLAITEPWGRYSVLYVIGVGGGGVMVLSWVGTVVHAVQDSRRAKRRRAQRS